MLLEKLKQKLQNIDTATLGHNLGYGSHKSFEKTLHKFLHTPDLQTWLKNGNFDFVFSAEEFVVNLCRVCEIQSDICSTQIQEAIAFNKELFKFDGCYIYVDTDFKRTGEPIFVLAAYEGRRRIFDFDKRDFVYKTIDEILQRVSTIVQEHYKSNHGELPLWGTIKHYVLHIFDKEYVFDTSGNFLKESAPIKESKAISRLG